MASMFEMLAAEANEDFASSGRDEVDSELSGGSEPKVTRSDIFQPNGPVDATRAFFANSPALLHLMTSSPKFYDVMAASNVSEDIFSVPGNGNSFIENDSRLKAILHSDGDPVVSGKPKTMRDAIKAALYSDGWVKQPEGAISYDPDAAKAELLSVKKREDSGSNHAYTDIQERALALSGVYAALLGSPKGVPPLDRIVEHDAGFDPSSLPSFTAEERKRLSDYISSKQADLDNSDVMLADIEISGTDSDKESARAAHQALVNEIAVILDYAERNKSRITSGNDIKDLFSNLPAPDGTSSPHKDFLDGLGGDFATDGMVSNGDESEIPVYDPKTGIHMKPTVPGQRLSNGFTIPERSKEWPAFMDWPNQRDMRALKDAEASAAQYAAYFERMKALEITMKARAQQIAEHISEYEQGKGLLNGARRRDHRAMARDRSNGPEYHSGVRWAFLVDPRQPNHALMNSMKSVGERRLQTMDNGEVIATQRTVSVRKTSEQAVAVAIHEGVSRGWTNMKMSGHPRFAKIAIQKAREANIRAEITITSGILGLHRKTIVVMPGVPAFEIGEDGLPLDKSKTQTTRADAPTDAPIGNKVPEDGHAIEDDMQPVPMSNGPQPG